jgi:hypothetical protein
MYLFDRETFDRVQNLEETIQDKRKGFFTISVNQTPMKAIKQMVENEINGWGIDEVKNFYKHIEQKQACGAFCHR